MTTISVKPALYLPHRAFQVSAQQPNAGCGGVEQSPAFIAMEEALSKITPGENGDLSEEDFERIAHRLKLDKGFRDRNLIARQESYAQCPAGGSNVVIVRSASMRALVRDLLSQGYAVREGGEIVKAKSK